MICMAAGGQKKELFDKLLDTMSRGGEVARKSVVSDGAEYRDLTGQEQKIVLLDGVGDVLFQALLLDDAEYGNNEPSANLHMIYCLIVKVVK